MTDCDNQVTMLNILDQSHIRQFGNGNVGIGRLGKHDLLQLLIAQRFVAQCVCPMCIFTNSFQGLTGHAVENHIIPFGKTRERASRVNQHSFLEVRNKRSFRPCPCYRGFSGINSPEALMFGTAVLITVNIEQIASGCLKAGHPAIRCYFTTAVFQVKVLENFLTRMERKAGKKSFIGLRSPALADNKLRFEKHDFP